MWETRNEVKGFPHYPQLLNPPRGAIMSITRISRFVIWICSKFTRTEIERIIYGLSEILANRNPDVKPKDDFKEKHPNYRNFYADPKPPLTEPPKKKLR